MKKFSSLQLSVLWLTLLAPAAFAKKIDVKWGVIAGAYEYEYQLSRQSDFSGTTERSGSTKNLYFVTDLGPGVYFLRVRGVDEKSRPGSWSQGVRLVVEANSLELVRPAAGDTMELAAGGAPLLIEWTAVEGAEDYQIQLQQKTQQRNLISPTNTVRVDGLQAGSWQLSVQARTNGQVIQKSKTIAFNVAVNPKPKPIVYSPMPGETTVAWDHFTIRWLNNAVAPKSEVVIRRMGQGQGGVVSREVVYGRAEAFSPKLPPGAYQISVRNLYESMTSEAAVVDVEAKADAMGYHAQYFGLTGQATLGPTLGTTGFENDGYSSEPQKFGHASGEIDFRLTADISSPWGIELGAGARGDRFLDKLFTSATSEEFVNIKATRLQPYASLGARYQMNPLGPSKPLWLRAWMFWRQVEMPVGSNGVINDLVVSAPSFRISNARIYGTGLGAEMRWGGTRSRWDVNGRVDVLIPWFAKGSRLATGGVSMLWPTVELRVTPRVTISSEMRLGIVLGGRMESLTLKEASGKDSKLSSVRVFLMPTLSWDL